MRSQFSIQRRTRASQHHIRRGCQLLFLFAMSCCLVGMTTDTAWAQSPEPLPGELFADAPDIVGFTAMQFPGEINWLISGRIVGCEEPADIDVAVRGVVFANARTDVQGYFKVIVPFTGSVGMLTAGADYEGFPLPKASCSIGF